MRQLKIITIIIFSLGVTIIVSKNIFLANTPKINTAFILEMKNFPTKLIAFTMNSFTENKANKMVKVANIKNINFAIKDIDKLPFRKMSQGVYATDVGTIKYYQVRQDEIQWSEITLKTKSGDTVTFRYPKDQPPAKEMLEIIKAE